MYREKIVNIQTGEETYRDYTAEEILLVESAQIETEEHILAEQNKQEAKKALLKKLGITEEEAQLLLS